MSAARKQGTVSEGDIYLKPTSCLDFLYLVPTLVQLHLRHCRSFDSWNQISIPGRQPLTFWALEVRACRQRATASRKYVADG